MLESSKIRSAIGTFIFERYDERFNPATGEGSVEIWFPIQRQP